MPIPWRLETWCHGPIFCLCYLWLLDSVQLISVAQNEPRVDVNRSLNGVGWNVWEKSQFNVELWWLISIEDTHALSVMQIWVIWAQSIDSMIKDCRIKRSNESLFKTELFSEKLSSFISRYLPRAVFLTTNRKWIVSDHMFAKISPWAKLPLYETSLRAPFKSSKQTTSS